MEITGGKARAGKNYLPGFQGICMPCWLLCKSAVSCMFCLEAADCWLRSSVNSLAETLEEKDKARGKTHARTVFVLLFTTIAWGCYWLMPASTLRISTACTGQKKPTNNSRWWFLPTVITDAGVWIFYPTHTQERKSSALLLSNARDRKRFCTWYTYWIWLYKFKFLQKVLQMQGSSIPDK